MRALALVALTSLGCARPTAAPAPASAPDPAPAPTPTASTALPKPAARALGDGPLERGRVSFQGMARPAKGGVDVRGVTIDDGLLRARLVAAEEGAPPADLAALLGAVLRVTATLDERRVDSPFDDAGLAVQTKMGRFFDVAELERVEVVTPAAVIEGTVGRSKGLFTVAGRLVDRHDLARAVPGAEAGRRVRLWGQPRDYVCRPDEQCLLQGELPLFDVARGEALP